MLGFNFVLVFLWLIHAKIRRCSVAVDCNTSVVSTDTTGCYGDPRLQGHLGTRFHLLVRLEHGCNLLLADISRKALLPFLRDQR